MHNYNVYRSSALAAVTEHSKVDSSTLTAGGDVLRHPNCVLLARRWGACEREHAVVRRSGPCAAAAALVFILRDARSQTKARRKRWSRTENNGGGVTSVANSLEANASPSSLTGVVGVARTGRQGNGRCWARVGTNSNHHRIFPTS